MKKLYACQVKPPLYEEENRIEITEKRFLIDGYSFGDRLLEGVMFEIKFNNNDEVISVEVQESAKGYFENLNQEKWLNAAKKYAESILSEGDEVDIPYDLKKKYFVNRNVAYIAD